jgi:GntR family transcriptional regulator
VGGAARRIGNRTGSRASEPAAGNRLTEAKARQVYLALRERIVSGALPFGAKLPNENDLADAHGVSRVTVRRALAELSHEHLIDRKPSTGTTVVYRPPSPIVADVANLLANVADMGKRTAVRLLAFEYVPATPALAESFGVAPGDMLQRSIRVRLIDDMPFSYLTTHVPESIGRTYSKQELGSGPLLRLLERSGVKVERATQRIGAALASQVTASALDTHVGSPLIELTRVVYDRDGRGVEHLHAYYRPDRYSFEIALIREHSAQERTWSPARPTSKSNAKPIRSRKRKAPAA